MNGRRLRLVPITIVAAALLLGLKAGEVLNGLSALAINDARAQAQTGASGQPAAPGQAPKKLIPEKVAAEPKPAPPQASATAPAQPRANTAPTTAPSTVPAAAPVAASASTAVPAASTAAQAIAQAPSPGEGSSPAGKPGPAAPARNEGSRDVTDYTKGEVELLESLARRREALDERGRELELRENLLAAAEKRIDERIKELKAIEAKVQGLIRQHDEEEDKNIRSLVKVYENMKPKDAARIFEQLDMQILLSVVERMKEAKLAPVLAQMDPMRAQRLTSELATRRQLPGPPKPASS